MEIVRLMNLCARKLLVPLLLVVLHGCSPAEEVSGLWWVAHGDGAPLQVRLYPDGSAWSDYPSNNPGTWTRQKDRIVCLWADDWKEVFVTVNEGWAKLGYAPGTELASPASNQSRAFHITTAPDGWFGIPPSK